MADFRVKKSFFEAEKNPKKSVKILLLFVGVPFFCFSRLAVKFVVVT